MIEILTGDCLDVLPTLPEKSVQTCVTSPPYWNLRDYGTATWEGGSAECDHVERLSRQDGERETPGGRGGSFRSSSIQYRGECICGARRIDSQLGLESTPEEYITRMVAVFREVWRVLKDDATLWVNMGDSYAANGTSGLGTTEGHGKFNGGAKHDNRIREKTVPSGLKPKDLCGMPWRLAFALQADGWYLRSDIIWSKPNPMPESVTDRPTKSHEYIFLLTKAERYYYDADAIREKRDSDHDASVFRGGSYVNNSTFDNCRGGKRTVNGDRKLAPLEGAHGALGMDGNGMRMPEKWDNPAGRNKRSVWTIATQPYSEAHFATFPEELPKLCILAGSKPGDTVLDPFAGSGTTGKVALELGRKAVLIELSPKYVEMMEARTHVTPGFCFIDAQVMI
jgi:DNA modification methylase